MKTHIINKEISSGYVPLNNFNNLKENTIENFEYYMSFSSYHCETVKTIRCSIFHKRFEWGFESGVAVATAACREQTNRRKCSALFADRIRDWLYFHVISFQFVCRKFWKVQQLFCFAPRLFSSIKLLFVEVCLCWLLLKNNIYIV